MSDADDLLPAIPGVCWNCGHDVLVLRPDAGMNGVTDEIVCVMCEEPQQFPGD